MRKNEKKFKRIGIDARFYGPVGKGLGRYTKEVVDRVVELDRDNEYIVFLSRENFDSFVCSGDRVKKILLKAGWYGPAEQIFFPWLIWRYRINLMHFPHFNVPLFCPSDFVVTIHDLILTRHHTRRASTLSPLFYRLKYLAYKVVIRTAVRRARRVIAVSKFTKNDIIRQFRIDKKKIIVTYEGVFDGPKEDNFSHSDKNALLRYNISEPYLLYVGNAYPHKNLEGLIRVFLPIGKKIPDLSLVLVGKDDYFYLRVKKFTQKLYSGLPAAVGRIIFPGYVPDDDLAVIYRHARAYVFPSFYEGFGLPPLEAMSRGCPVVASGKSSMPEILGPAALYFNPDDEDDMRGKIERIIRDSRLRQDLAAKGRERVKEYSWEKCAKETLAIYRLLLKLNHTYGTCAFF